MYYHDSHQPRDYHSLFFQFLTPPEICQTTRLPQPCSIKTKTDSDNIELDDNNNINNNNYSKSNFNIK